MEILPPEMLLQILKRVNYSTTCRFCVTNSRHWGIRNDSFLWRDKANSEFDLTKRVNRLWEGETEKERYLRLVTRKGEIYPGSERYISLNRIIENISVIHPLDRPYFYALIENHEHKDDLYQKTMESASESGNEEIVEDMLKLKSNLYNIPMMKAAKGGHAKIVNRMLDLGATNYDMAMVHAAVGGHVDLVKRMLKLGATSYNETMRVAGYSGNIEIVDMMIDRGATYFGSTMITAAEQGKLAVVEKLLSKVSVLKFAIAAAAVHGHLEVVNRLMREDDERGTVLNVSNYSCIMGNAAEGNLITVVENMMIRGAPDYETAAYKAARGNNLEILDLMLELGATNYEKIMVEAAEMGHINIVDKMLNLGAKNYGEALEHSAPRGHIEIVDKMLHLGSLSPDCCGVPPYFFNGNSYFRAMNAAKIDGYLEVSEMLLDHIKTPIIRLI